MRSRLTIAALLAASALASGSLLPAQAAQPSARPLASVKLSSCSRADNTAIFYGRMRRTAAGERMRMRFTLLEQGSDGRFEPVRAPGLGRWRRSQAGVRAFGYRQRVAGLSEGAVYRARVDFRWSDAAGALTRRLRRRSRPCVQAGPQPNLRARVMSSSPTQVPGVARYDVRVLNLGRSAAPESAVLLSVDGSAVDTRTVSSLEPREYELVSFRGPTCQNAVEAVADPDAAVPESSETDNGHVAGCAELARD